GVQSIRMALAISPDRRNDWNNVVVEQSAEQPSIDALDAARELIIDAAQNAGRVSDEGVAIGPAQVGGRQSFQQLVRNAVGGRESQLKGGLVGNARPIEVGSRLARLLGKAANLVGGAVNQGEADAQAAQERHVEKQVA